MSVIVIAAALLLNAVLLCALITSMRQVQFLAFKILKRLTPARARKVLFFTTRDGKQQRIEEMVLKVSQALPLSVAFADAKGNPAQVEGKPAWALTDESLAILEVAEDGLSALLKPIGPLGSFKVQVSADGDLGEGVKSIVGELAIDLIAADAVSVVISAGEPVEQA